MKNNISKILISVSTFAILLITYNQAQACIPWYVYPHPDACYGETYLPSYEVQEQVIYYPTYSYQPSVANTYPNTNYSSTTYKTTTKTNTDINNKIATSAQTKVEDNNEIEDNNCLPTVAKSSKVDKNSLTALSLKGKGGFMPSSIWQWLLVIVLILVIVIISRLLFKKPKDTYNPHHVAPAH